MKITSNLLRVWLPLAVTSAALCLLNYTNVQQVYRMGLNDPQIQLTEDAARPLSNGANASSQLPAKYIDPSQSLAPFVVVYDDHGKAVASSGQVGGHTPTPPSGVFEYARQHGQDRITWQLGDGTRLATVVRHYDGAHSGFVLSARNMREVENREQQALLMTVATLTGVLVVTLAVVAIL